ncbi:MAG: NADH:flavin oxidoreductase [Bacteroidetes bacterium]|nr:NADH:flavin oxidoreductase [Bacteroidota bacterium]
MTPALFDSIRLGTLALCNRIVRAATYEGGADADGTPGADYRRMYEELAAQDIGLIVTGFTFVSRQGRAMQPRQAGLDDDAKLPAFRAVTDAVHRGGTPIVAQLAHAGRQTRCERTGERPVSCTRTPSVYFRERPRLLRDDEIQDIAAQFARAAARAQRAGFDGVQLHAAHGYLLHQFLLPQLNRLRGPFGVDETSGIGTALLGRVIDGVRSACGPDYPVLVKISGETDLGQPFFPTHFDRLIDWLREQAITAVEISCGSMDYALNIFRGDLPFALVRRHNPLLRSRLPLLPEIKAACFRKRILPLFRPFAPMYNLAFAERAKLRGGIPVVTVGGVRSRREMVEAVEAGRADLVALSRPFLREPDLVRRLRCADNDHVSPCRNCNHCVIMCDADRRTRCYQRSLS